MEPAKRRKQRRQQGGKGMQDQNCAAPDHVRARDQDGHRQADAKRQSEDSGSDDKRAGQQAPQRRIGDQAEIEAASASSPPDERPQQRKNTGCEQDRAGENGRASGRGREWQHVENTDVAVGLKKNNENKYQK